MKDSQFNPDPHDPQWDATDPVWRLLGESPRPEPDAWFAARTLARCRHEALGMDASGNSLARLAGLWRWALGGGLAFAMALAFVFTQVFTQVHSEKADKEKNVQEAFQIMASIDTDSDSSSSSWQDSSSL